MITVALEDLEGDVATLLYRRGATDWVNEGCLIYVSRTAGKLKMVYMVRAIQLGADGKNYSEFGVLTARNYTHTPKSAEIFAGFIFGTHGIDILYGQFDEANGLAARSLSAFDVSASVERTVRDGRIHFKITPKAGVV
jgi:hypothetical protein